VRVGFVNEIRVRRDQVLNIEIQQRRRVVDTLNTQVLKQVRQWVGNLPLIMGVTVKAALVSPKHTWTSTVKCVLNQ
jgi:hypothetical protein